MSNPLTRRSFIHFGTALCVGTVAFGQEQLPTVQPATKPARKPPIEYELVKAFVGAAHGDLDKTRTLLDEHPRLLNATMDHSNGDFEAAIGGAGHMGRRDIAQFLIDRGARFDIFVAAMMGQLEIVKAMIEAFPQAKNSLGPHGIDLMTHAQKGKSQNVIEYLKSLG
jgi:hypothetical protein